MCVCVRVYLCVWGLGDEVLYTGVATHLSAARWTECDGP